LEEGYRGLELHPSIKICLSNVKSQHDVIKSKAKVGVDAFIQERLEVFRAKGANGSILHGECSCKDGNFKRRDS